MAAALPEPTFLILVSLAEGRKHGYALIEDARRISDGRVDLKVATLYTTLDRLVSRGLAARAGDEVVDGRLRRYYELTDSGVGLLQAEIDRMTALASAATVRLSARPARVRPA